MNKTENKKLNDGVIPSTIDEPKKKNIFGAIKLYLKPFLTIKDHKLIFFLWFAFTVFAGQIGVISNIIIRYINGKSSFQEVIYSESINGSFYIYSIALLASTLGPLFVNLIEKPQTKFKGIKVVTIVLAIFTLLFASVFYTSTQPNITNLDIYASSFNIDKWQLGFLLTSILLSIYAYSVLRLEHNPDQYKELDEHTSYALEVDKDVKILTNTSDLIKEDPDGIRL